MNTDNSALVLALRTALIAFLIAILAALYRKLTKENQGLNIQNMSQVINTHIHLTLKSTEVPMLPVQGETISPVEEAEKQEPFSFFSRENPISFFSPAPEFTPEELEMPIIQIYKNFLES